MTGAALLARPLIVRSLVAAALIAGCLIAPLALAEPLAGAQATLGEAAAPASGRVAINLAAGVGNQEANAATIALGEAALASGSLHQAMTSSGVSGGAAIATIGANALAHSSGMLAVNVAAGHENQLGNLAVVAIGIEAIAATETMLSQSRASQQPNGPTGPSSPDAHVADLSATAFSGSSGLVQSNLIGGERNSSSNSFALTVLGEDPL